MLCKKGPRRLSDRRDRVRAHLMKHHCNSTSPTVDGSNNTHIIPGPFKGYEKQFRKEIAIAKSRPLTDYYDAESAKVKDMPACLFCKQAFESPKQWDSHRKSADADGCKQQPYSVMLPSVKLVCGRFHGIPAPVRWQPPVQQVHGEIWAQLSNPLQVGMLPDALCLTEELIASKLEPLLRHGESLASWPRLLGPLVSDPDFIPKVVSQLQQRKQDLANPDHNLLRAFELVDVTFRHFEPINRTIGRLRVKLQKFENPEDEGGSGRWLFHTRMSYASIQIQTKKLLSWLYKSGHPEAKDWFNLLATTYRAFSTFQLFQVALLPRLLCVLATERPGVPGGAPILLRFFFTECFRVVNDCKLELKECGQCSEKASSLLHAIRFSTCHLIHIPGKWSSEKGADALVTEIQQSNVVNTLSPIVSSLRMDYRRKPPRFQRVVDAHCNVVIEGYMFFRRYYQRLIPYLHEAVVQCLDECFADGRYTEFLNLENRLFTTDKFDRDVRVLLGDGSYLSLERIPLNQEMLALAASGDCPIVIQKLVSLVQFCFFGLGGGALRKEPVDSFQKKWIAYVNNDLFYTLGSNKKGHLAANPSDPETHKLPTCITRTIFLAKKVFGLFMEDDCPEFFPNIKEREYEMGHCAAEAFHLGGSVDARVLRQFFCSITNILFPNDNLMMEAVAQDDVARISHHTPQTAASSYGTIRASRRDEIFLITHQFLGDCA